MCIRDRVCAEGTAEEISESTTSITGLYLSGKKQIEVPKERIKPGKKITEGEWLFLDKTSGHNLKNLSLQLPIGLFVCVTGVSGSGKSTLINQTLLPAVSNILGNKEKLNAKPYGSIKGAKNLLLHIAGPSDMKMNEMVSASNFIYDEA